MNRTVVACLVSIGSICGLAKLAQAQEFAYRGMCDASAAVALDAGHFVVANDERNTLRVYKRGQSDPVDSVPIFEFLKTKEKKESDLEEPQESEVGSTGYRRTERIPKARCKSDDTGFCDGNNDQIRHPDSKDNRQCALHQALGGPLPGKATCQI